jgi:hypothetical protein
MLDEKHWLEFRKALLVEMSDYKKAAGYPNCIRFDLVWPDLDIAAELEVRKHDQVRPIVMQIDLTCIIVLPEEWLSDGCCSCGDFCDDADDPMTPTTRLSNCVRCEPCYLCADCCVQHPDGYAVCLLCIEREELDYWWLSSRQRLRWHMVDRCWYVADSLDRLGVASG